jgi:hypothetical protein
VIKCNEFKNNFIQRENSRAENRLGKKGFQLSHISFINKHSASLNRE